MLYFNKTGLSKLKSILSGTLVVRIDGSYNDCTEELSVILTKLSYIAGYNKADLLTTEGIGYSGSVEVITPSDVFTYFGVTTYSEPIPDSAVNSRNLGFLYEKNLGEALMHNTVLNLYVCNDGSTINSEELGSTVALKKEYFMKYMPDLYKDYKQAEKQLNAKLKKLGLSGLTEGSSVKIKTYEELVATHGQQALVVDDQDKPLVVDTTTDPDALWFIKDLKYPMLSAMYYSRKVGKVITIDATTGTLVLDIEGTTTHNKFIDNGEVSSNSSEQIQFTFDHIELA